jgi:hypothetical protein
MLLNIHIEESLRIRNKKISSEWPFKDVTITKRQALSKFECKAGQAS